MNALGISDNGYITGYGFTAGVPLVVVDTKNRLRLGAKRSPVAHVPALNYKTQSAKQNPLSL
jgi:hypothetical protein